MVRDRSALGVPFGADGPWLAAILGALDDIHGVLVELRDRSVPSGDAGPVPIREPAPGGPPPTATPVTEPEPDEPPDDDPVPVTEPAPDPPPRAGRGASADAWRAFAGSLAVTIPDNAGRDDIIAACERAGVLPT